MNRFGSARAEDFSSRAPGKGGPSSSEPFVIVSPDALMACGPYYPVLRPLALIALICATTESGTVLVSRDHGACIVDASAAAARSRYLRHLIDIAEPDESGNTLLHLRNVDDAELRTIVEFINTCTCSKHETGRWAQRHLAAMDRDALCKLMTAAHNLGMPSLATAIMWTKRTWNDIIAMRERLKRNVFRFAVSKSPVILRLKHMALTDDQVEIVQTIQDLLVVGSTYVHLLNLVVWDSGMNVLQWAAQHGETLVVELLVSAPGIDVDARDEFGSTPLHLAVSGGHIGVVRLLVDARQFKVNCRDHQGRTPLHIAADMGRDDIVRVLQGGSTIGVTDRKANALALRSSQAGPRTHDSGRDPWDRHQPAYTNRPPADAGADRFSCSAPTQTALSNPPV